jgi:hypothetical protein
VTRNPWLVPLVLFGIAMLVLAAIGAVAVAGFLWIDRSSSERAGRIRRLLGGREKKRDAGEPRFLRTGEARTLRKNAARLFAAKRHLSHQSTDQTLLPLLRPFKSVPLQSTGAIEDLIEWRKDGFHLALASYTSEDSEAVNTNTLLYVDLADLKLPAFLIATETLAHRLLFSGRDINFPDDEPFSSHFHLQGGHEGAIRGLCSSAVRAEFLTVGACRLESAGSALVFIEAQQSTVAGFEIFVDESMRLMTALIRQWNAMP